MRALIAILFSMMIATLSPPPASAQEIALGDSIACGVKAVGHLQGGCRIGASPLAVYQMVTTYPAEAYKNQVVILSCGVSNNPQQLEYCQKDTDWILEHGGKIILLGVGSSIPDSVEINKMLEAFATTSSGIFIWGWHDVHPSNYQQVLTLARENECTEWCICGT